MDFFEIKDNKKKYLENLKFSHDYWQLILPVVLMLIDIITGYYNAYIKKEISSSKMRDGLGKKLAELVYIIVSLLISVAFNVKIVGYFFSLYIIYMELVSIMENCKKLGVAMPDFIKDKLNNKEGE